ncbi:RNA-binding cell elongation regulator Jag/EloR [Trichococcus ilyis]|jgi:spoIIIJ-associated protein|uniref:RNA-binding protein KhpB n=1 Tax=Trichococcus ilyis TaxID=640938 RepID=A0A143YBU1_9LACT|nr:RNA-binding cell elongation regulator Jag/EloR [Trichococcus ilyis]CZQ85064.1 jag n-terminus [Trichococcus ilyis]SEJ59119.1 spoIIIJ-associated protein [Trichococcus ilyis]
MDKVVAKDTTVDKAIRKGLDLLGVDSHEADIVVISEGKKGIFGFGQKEAVVEITRKEIMDFDEPGDIQLAEIDETVEDIVEDLEEDYPEAAEKILADQPEVDRIISSDEEEDAEAGHFPEDYDEEAGRAEAIAAVSAYLASVAEAYGAPAVVTVEEKNNMLIFQMESEKAGLLIGKYGKIVNALQILAQALVQRYVRRRLSVIVNVGDYRERRAAVLESIADRTAERVIKTKQPVFLEPLPAFERKLIHARLSQNKRIKTHSEGKEPHRYLVVEIAE